MSEQGVVFQDNCFSCEDIIYIDSRDVILQDGRIYFLLENNWIPIQTLGYDGRGYYVQRVRHWKCNNCGFEMYLTGGIPQERCPICGEYAWKELSLK